MKYLSVTNRLVALVAIVLSPQVLAEQQSERLSEPVYRVAHETPAQQVSATSTPVAANRAAAEADFFDVTQQPGEHPLAPYKRLAERVLNHIDANVSDYSCRFAKVERIDGELQEPNHIDMQVMNSPFSVHMLFQKPKQGQECLYVAGQNGGKMKARAHGWRGSIAGVLTLDPDGSLAMTDNRHPITKAGMRNLTAELIKTAENDMKYGECEVQTNPDVKVGGRPAMMLQITHPTPRKEFKYHVARIYIDRELKLPVAYQAYDWQTGTDGKPLLVEQYTYTNLSLNNGYTANHFQESNPEYFK